MRNIIWLILFIPSVLFSQTAKKYEYCDDEPNYYADKIDDDEWLGNQFIVGTVGDNDNHKVDSIYYFGRTTGSDGTINFYIDTVDGSNFPTGNHKFSGSIAMIDLTQNEAGAGYYITMTGSDSLYANGHYALYATSTSTSATYWFSNNAGTYSGGYEITYDGSWSEWSSYDIRFEIYGTSPTPPQEAPSYTYYGSKLGIKKLTGRTVQFLKPVSSGSSGSSGGLCFTNLYCLADNQHFLHRENIAVDEDVGTWIRIYTWGGSEPVYSIHENYYDTYKINSSTGLIEINSTVHNTVDYQDTIRKVVIKSVCEGV